MSEEAGQKCPMFFYGDCPIIKQENEDLIKEFLDDYRSDKRAIIVLNIERNMKAEDHIQYNDVFNKRLDKWEGKLKE